MSTKADRRYVRRPVLYLATVLEGSSGELAPFQHTELSENFSYWVPFSKEAQGARLIYLFIYTETQFGLGSPLMD
jgi:hypothetical protein